MEVVVKHLHQHMNFVTVTNVLKLQDWLLKNFRFKEGTYSTTFQSRLGFDPWLQPYTDRTIERLGKKALKKWLL